MAIVDSTHPNQFAYINNLKHKRIDGTEISSGKEEKNVESKRREKFDENEVSTLSVSASICKL